jgi:peptidoglycan/LPS O-acetylase OafA/YrhL
MLINNMATVATERWHTTDVLVILLALCLVARVRFTSIGKDRVPRSTDAWTGVRFVFIGSIFLLHCGFTDLNCAGPFLILSGAVLSFGRVEEYATCHGYFLFMVRRIARIAPVYWIVVLVNYLGGDVPAAELVQDVFLSTSWFTQDMSWLWFISTIAWLYAFFPLLGLAIVKLRIPGSVWRSCCLMLLALALQMAVAAWVYNTKDMNPARWHKFERRIIGNYVVALYQWPPARLPEFLLGAGLAHFGRALKGRGALILGPLGDLAFAGLVVLAIWSSPAWHLEELPPRGLMAYVFRMDLLSPIFCLWLLGLGFGKPASSSSWSLTGMLLQRRTMLALGELSFGFYLWHYLFLDSSWFMVVGDGPHACNVISGSGSVDRCSLRSLSVRFAVALIAAFATYEIVEKPIAEFCKNLRTQPPAPTPPLVEKGEPEAQEEGRAQKPPVAEKSVEPEAQVGRSQAFARLA